MKKISRKERELIKKLANNLPVTYYEAQEKALLKGIEILKDKNITKGDFQGQILPNKFYEVGRTVRRQVNHNNRLTTAFENGGLEAVDKYCVEVFELVEGSLTPIEGLQTTNATC